MVAFRFLSATADRPTLSATKENGFLADYLSADSLAEGIRWGISEARTAISKENMRSEVFRKYSGEVVAKQYLNLYQNLIRRKVTQ